MMTFTKEDETGNTRTWNERYDESLHLLGWEGEGRSPLAEVGTDEG
jgi:hypothetical protein